MSLLQSNHRLDKSHTDIHSGPTVEKGLAALDSLYDLRNVIPGLISSSKLPDQEGEFSVPQRSD